MGINQAESSRTPYGKVKCHHQEVEHLSSTQHCRTDGREIKHPVSVGGYRHLWVVYEKKIKVAQIGS